MLRRVFLVLLVLGFAAAPAAAQISAEDARAIRAVISEQLEAFARDDAPRAFSLAATGIRERFGTPEAFIEMVRTGYPVVYRPRSVQFDGPVVVDGIVLQPVRMTDAAGVGWVALYPMERQPDGVWRINGCQLVRLPGRSA